MKSAVPLALVIAVSAHASEEDTTILYRRATPIEARTGMIEVRVVEEALAEVPVGCQGPDLASCGGWEQVRFARIYGIKFSIELREARGEAPSVEVEPRGEAYLFLNFERNHLDAFDQKLRQTLAALSVGALVHAHGGLEPSSGPLGEIARLTAKSSWSCFDDGSRRVVTAYEHGFHEGSDGKRRAFYGTRDSESAEHGERLCETGSLVVRSAAPEEIRTMPSDQALREDTVRVRIAGRIPAVAQPEDLVPLPDRFLYTCRDEDPDILRNGLRSTEKVTTGTLSVEDGSRIVSELTPAAFPPNLVKRGLVAQWTAETIERTMGARPRDEPSRRSVVRMAIVPTRPPIRADEIGANTAVPTDPLRPRFDTDTLLQRIVRRLESAERVDLERFSDLIWTQSVFALTTDAFVVFICRNEAAHFVVLPTAVRQRVTNDDELCGAIDRALEDESSSD